MRKKKVAITGIHNSGKTMFLTSLLWQLDEIEEAEFYLKPGLFTIRLSYGPIFDSFTPA